MVYKYLLLTLYNVSIDYIFNFSYSPPMIANTKYPDSLSFPLLKCT